MGEMYGPTAVDYAAHDAQTALRLARSLEERVEKLEAALRTTLTALIGSGLTGS